MPVIVTRVWNKSRSRGKGFLGRKAAWRNEIWSLVCRGESQERTRIVGREPKDPDNLCEALKEDRRQIGIGNRIFWLERRPTSKSWETSESN